MRHFCHFGLLLWLRDWTGWGNVFQQLLTTQLGLPGCIDCADLPQALQKNRLQPSTRLDLGACNAVLSGKMEQKSIKGCGSIAWSEAFGLV